MSVRQRPLLASSRRIGLEHAGLARDGGDRDDPRLIPRLRADPETRVLVVRGDAAPVRVGPRSQLRLCAPSAAPDGALWAFLGRIADGTPLLLAALPADAPVPRDLDGPWATLRAVGGELDAVHADALAAGVSLGRWLGDAAFCPACGGDTALTYAGWARTCRRCGREHFPRTDPAMIVAVEDEDHRRLLLGSNVLWGHERFSCFAGFVEAGESAEQAVVRELDEEAGIRVTALAYRGSQAWPYPRSLMLGFRATAATDPAPRADGDEIAEVRWFTRPQIADALRRGDWSADSAGVRLPGTASIARRLIVDWLDDA